MFILDNLENTGKRNEENNYQGSQYPFSFKALFSLPFCSPDSFPAHFTFLSVWELAQRVGGPWNSVL